MVISDFETKSKRSSLRHKIEVDASYLTPQVRYACFRAYGEKNRTGTESTSVLVDGMYDLAKDGSSRFVGRWGEMRFRTEIGDFYSLAERSKRIYAGFSTSPCRFNIIEVRMPNDVSSLAAFRVGAVRQTINTSVDHGQVRLDVPWLVRRSVYRYTVLVHVIREK